MVAGGVVVALLWPDSTESDAQIAQLQQQLEEQQVRNEESEEQIAEAQAQAAAAIAEADAAGGGGNSPAELSAARLATGLISVPDENGNSASYGSGVLVSDDGLVLTNIHVALPGVFFERTGDPAFAGRFNSNVVIIAFPSVDGGPVDLLFLAEQVAAHPSHDAALLRVIEALGDATLNDLPDPLPIGESGALLAGDQIAIVGYPGDAFTDRVSVALTNFQSFQSCFPDDTVCLDDYDEGWLNLAGETLQGGSSGGPIIHGGEVVGLQQGALITGTANNQELGVPIDLVVEELDVG